MATGRFLRILRRAVLLVPTFVVLVFFVTTGWLLLTQSGLERAAALVAWASEDAVRIVGARGSLIGPLALDRTEIRAGADRYTLHEIAIDWAFMELLHGQIDIRRLRIEQLALDLAGSETGTPPADLRLPLAVRVAALEIGTITGHGEPAPLAGDIAASFESDGTTHRLNRLSLRHHAGTLTAQGSLVAEAPFALAATAALATTGEPALEIALRLGGTLENIEAGFDGRGADFSLAGNASLRPFDTQPLATLRLTARGLDPRAFMAAAPRARLALDADLVTDAAGALAGPLRIDNAAPAPLDRDGLPFAAARGKLWLDWNVAPDQARRVRLDQLELKVGAGGTAHGTLDLLWPRAAALPHGSATLAVRHLDPATLHTAAFVARLDGRLNLSGDAAVQQATLALADGARRIEATLIRQGDRLEIVKARLAQGTAELVGSGALKLATPHDWRFAGTLRRFDPARFVADLPHAQLNGRFAADGRLAPQLAGHLNFALEPSQLAGELLAGRGELMFAGIHRIDDLIAANGRARIAGELDLKLGSSRVAATGSWGGPAETLTVELAAPDLARHRALFATLPPALQNTTGALDLTATLSGFPERPELVFDVRARRLALAGGSVTQLDANGRLQGDQLNLTLTAAELGAATAPRLPQLTLDIAGTRSAHQLKANATLGGGQRIELVASGALDESLADWRDSGWRGRLDTLTLTGKTPAQVAASGELDISRRVLTARFAGQVPNLAGLGSAIDPGIATAGTLDFHIGLSGTPTSPRFNGQMRGTALVFELLDYGLKLHEGSFALRFDETHAHLERLEFIAPHTPPTRAARIADFPANPAPGRLSAQGDFAIAARSARLAVRFERLPLFQQAERWLVVSGTAQIAHKEARAQVDAKLVADAGFVAEAAASGRPRLSDDIVVRGREAKPRAALRIEGDIDLDLGKHFHLRAAGLAARLAGQLRIRGGSGEGEGRLVATGSIAAQEATFEAYGQRLAVERGIVNFQGRIDDPGLNVLAVRKTTLIEAGVAVTGTTQRPVVRLVSTPPVPDAEKLSWIVLGRPPDASGADASLLVAAAGTILGGSEEGLTTQLAQALGLDELSLRQAPDGDALASQILTVGKRLSSRASLSYEQGLTAATGALKFTYALTPRISLVTRAGEDNAADVFYNFMLD